MATARSRSPSPESDSRAPLLAPTRPDHAPAMDVKQPQHVTGEAEVETVDFTSATNVAKQQVPETLVDLTDDEFDKVGRSATWKMDIQILPVLVIMYILNFLDRQNIASAKLANIEEDLNLSPVQYQTCVSILFVGYILMQVPSNMLLGKIKYPGTYICFAMACWGVVSGCMAAVHSFTGLLLTRFFVGFVEAIFFPGALYFLSMFYNRKQYALRAAILYSGSQLGNAFGGLFAIGILRLDGEHGLTGWQWLFLVEGVLTVGLALIFTFILPNSPKTIRLLTPAERDWVQYNYEQDQGQADNSAEITAKQGLLMAVKDPKTWMLMATLYCIFISAAVTNFFPSVVATLGFDRSTTYALTAPPYILAVFVMTAVGFHSDKKQERYLHIVIPLAVTVAANIVAVATTNTGARYFAMMLLPCSMYSGSTIVLSWISNSLAQPAAKRAAGIALINAIVNTPNIWCSYLYFGKPKYLVAFLVNLAAAGAAIALATMTRIYLRRQNGKLDKGLAVGKSGPTQAQIASGYRYVL